MDKYLICILLMIQIVLFVLFIFRFQRSEELNQRFVISQQALMEIIEHYYNYVFIPKLMNMKKQYDLDPTSRTQSIKAYDDAYNTLLSESAKDIMKRYLSDKALKVLMNYYSVDGLILLIISNLKR